jgi:cyclopropane fatty-acyl-phospholipid synthase-like methyltransferase
MVSLNPLDIIMWTIRRNEHDIVNMYDSLSPMMQITTDGDMLNFGYWNKDSTTPLSAQNRLCEIVGELAELDSKKTLLDVGCGLLGPAKKWKKDFPYIDIFSININFSQLKNSKISSHDKIIRLNSTSRLLPFTKQSVDCIVALESAQHFKKLEEFIYECKRILEPNGILVFAIPIISEKISNIKDLGILSFTWTSEHYTLEHVTSKIKSSGFKIVQIDTIGKNVYPPMADYYMKNRKSLQKNISSRYPKYVEKILFNSMKKMKKVSENKIIDYVLIKCKL